MNFFALQERARQRTGRLIFFYGLAVAMIIVVVYLVLAVLTSGALSEDPESTVTLWNPELFAGTAIGLLVVIGLGTLYQVAALSSGGTAVAEMLGGRLVPAQTRDPLEKRFLNVVEEMALASGIPVPKAYVLDEEAGINAFAAGVSTSNAVVAVTRGCLETLNRDELQGVVGHEFSHILNGDMRLNLRLIGVLHGILLISLIGYGMFRMAGVFGGNRRSSRDSKNSGGSTALAIMLAGLAIWLIGYVGVFFANLIKSAVSREREYLADASAVQFTRNPQGLAGALKKIGALAAGSRMESPRASQASHLFFANGLSGAWFSLLATHPPLIDRIRHLEPTFDGNFDKIRLDPGPVGPISRIRPILPGDSQKAGIVAGLGGTASAPATVALDSLSAQVGTPAGPYLAFVHEFVQALPAELKAAIREPRDAKAVAFSLLLAAEPGDRAPQLKILESRCGGNCRTRTEALALLVREVPRNGLLPLSDLVMGTLRQMPRDEYETFRSTAMALTAADEKIDLFEYAFLRLMVRRLDAAFGRGRKPGPTIGRLNAVRRECDILIGTLARFGQPVEASAIAAFRSAMERLFPGMPAELPPSTVCTLKNVDAALNRLADLRPTLKEAILDACGLCAGQDGRVTVEEADLLRAVADALDCPVPPLSLRVA